MSTLKTTNIQHASAASAAITLASDGSAAATLSSLNGGPLSGTRNRIINGDMRIDQRNAGASVTYPGGGSVGNELYVIDRWMCNSTGSTRFSMQRSTTAPSGFTNSLLITTTTAGTPGASDFCYFGQNIEGFNVADLDFGLSSAKTVTLSFWVRSSLIGTFGGSLANSAANRRYPFSFAISAANTWEYKTVTIAGDTTGTWLTDNGRGFTLSLNLGNGSSNKGTAGAWATVGMAPTGTVDLVGTNGATFYITGVQLEAGSVATPFERRSYGQELALCQRYCWVFGNVDNSVFGVGYETPAVGRVSAATPVTMRSSPTFQSSGAGGFTLVDSGSSGRLGTAIALAFASPTSVSVDLSASGTTANAACIMRTTGPSMSMTFSAEL